MSKPQFDVRIANYENISEISGSWTPDDFKKLLIAMDYPPEDAGSDSELRELCVMCLQDREPAAAAEVVLTYKLNDRLAKGQIQNLAIEMPDEKLWEHYADLSLHESFFHVGTLMFEAFPDLYHEPDAVKILLEVSPKNPAAIELLNKPLHESLLARMLATGMEASSILQRLFEDQLAGDSFPESDSIIWKVGPTQKNGEASTIEIVSSAHWMEDLKAVDRFEASATPDAGLNRVTS